MNVFQKYWSYAFRIVVEQASSEFNPKLIVAIQDGKYVLNTQNANYSFGSLHRVFQQAFRKIKLTKQNTKTVLLLGGGTGSVPSIIYNELGLSPKMDTVEIDEKVIELGNKYFDLEKYSKVNVYIEDAAEFIKRTTNNYDLIVIDLFQGINVPKEFQTLNFFQKVYSLLSPQGTILFNYVAYNHETKTQTKEIGELIKNKMGVKVEIFKLENINRVFCIRK
jgi:spermidine synthase